MRNFPRERSPVDDLRDRIYFPLETFSNNLEPFVYFNFAHLLVRINRVSHMRTYHMCLGKKRVFRSDDTIFNLFT